MKQLQATMASRSSFHKIFHRFIEKETLNYVDGRYREAI